MCSFLQCHIVIQMCNMNFGDGPIVRRSKCPKVPYSETQIENLICFYSDGSAINGLYFQWILFEYQGW